MLTFKNAWQGWKFTPFLSLSLGHIPPLPRQTTSRIQCWTKRNTLNKIEKQVRVNAAITQTWIGRHWRWPSFHNPHRTYNSHSSCKYAMNIIVVVIFLNWLNKRPWPRYVITYCYIFFFSLASKYCYFSCSTGCSATHGASFAFPPPSTWTKIQLLWKACNIILIVSKQVREDVLNKSVLYFWWPYMTADVVSTQILSVENWIMHRVYTLYMPHWNIALHRWRSGQKIHKIMDFLIINSKSNTSIGVVPFPMLHSKAKINHEITLSENSMNWPCHPQFCKP